jgi:hypothetical protein
MIKKSIAVPAIALIVLFSLSAAGCTTSVASNTTNSPSSTADMTAKLNNAFTSQNYTIVKPFTSSVNQYGNVIYSGVVKDGPDKLVPYAHNLTVEETKNRNESLARFNAYVGQALGQKYAELSTGNVTGVWLGANNVMTANPTKEAAVRINEPNHGIMWWGAFAGVMDPNYTVSVDYSTKV